MNISTMSTVTIVGDEMPPRCAKGDRARRFADWRAKGKEALAMHEAARRAGSAARASPSKAAGCHTAAIRL